MDSTFIQNPCANKENIKAERLGLNSPVPGKKHKVEEENSNPHSISETQENAIEKDSFPKTRSLSFHNPTNSAFRCILSHTGPRISHRDPNIPESTVKSASIISTTSLLNKNVSHSECSSTCHHRSEESISLETEMKPVIVLGKQASGFSTIDLVANLKIKTESFSPEYISNSQQIFMNSFLSQSLFGKFFKETPSAESTPHLEPAKPQKETGITDKISKFINPNENSKKTVHCNCRNSKCLKLYCECLAHGEFCDDYCNCFDCHNCKQKESVRAYAVSLILEKNPSFLEGQKAKKKAGTKIVRGKGCNCKKSVCLKKYCECFNSGVGCGPYCKCEGCKNSFGKKSDSEEGFDSQVSLEKMENISLTKTLQSTEDISYESSDTNNSSNEANKHCLEGINNKVSGNRAWLIQKQTEIIKEQSAFNILNFLMKEANSQQENICQN